MWALYSFLKNKNSYMDCILHCYRVGGDVDTIAKIAGAYSGCYLGITKISDLKYHIHDNNKKYEQIKNQITKFVGLIKCDKIKIIK